MAVLPDVPPNRGAPRTPLGRPGEPILPASLRVAWASEQLPAHVLARAGATRPISFDQLTARVHERVEQPDVLVEHVVRTIQSRQPAIARLLVCDRVDPATRVHGLELSARTRNALLRAGRMVEGDKLPTLTWGRLLSVRNLGVRSALEFAIALDRSGRRRTRAPQSDDSRSPDGHLAADARRTLERTARTAWANQLTLNDERLRALARRDRRTVAEAIEAALRSADGSELRDAHQLVSIVDALQEIGERLEGERLEAQLRELIAVLTDLDNERLDALCARMGLAGPAATLQVAGDMASVTRERIRQLQVKLIDRLNSVRHLYLPAVDAAVTTLQRAAPVRVEDGEKLLAVEKITRGRLDLSLFIGEWLPALGRRQLTEAEHGRARWIIRPELGGAEEQLAGAGFFDGDTDRAILDSIGRLCRSVGVCSVPWAAEEAGLSVDRETIKGVRRVAKSDSALSFLNRSWMWDPTVPTGRNRLENTLRKVLAVAPEVPMADLMGALDRVHRQGRLPRLPSAEAVAAFARAHPSFEEADERVRAAVALDPATELAGTERVFVEVLSAVPGGVLDREALRRACMERGMNGATFGQYTSFSPILTQPARNLWALRGREVDATVAQRVAATRRRRRRHAESTRTPDGRLQVSWTITGPEASVFAIPSADRFGYINRDYHAAAADGSSVGTVRVDEGGMSWGYGRFLRQASVATGDRLIATFDRDRRAVTLEVERGGARPWVGDLGNCFLHRDSWALRIYVDDELLAGGEWSIPLSLADAVGISPGTTDVSWRRDASHIISISRDDGACVGAQLSPVLRELAAKRGDRLFVELHTEWFDAERRPPAEPNGDPLQELLAGSGLPAALHGEAAWGALSRSLGGSSDGDRHEVEERLRQRGDHVGLGTLQRWRATTRVLEQSWPTDWWLAAPLAEDVDSYSVHNEAGLRRVAVGVASRGASLPSDALVDARGVVWADEDRVADVVSELDGRDGVTLTNADHAWSYWARAEHAARRASLRGSSWCIQPTDGQWCIDGGRHGDLRAALMSVSEGSGDPVSDIRAAVGFRYPSNAFAFRRIVRDLVRDGLTVIRAGSAGFAAEFETTPLREGPGLVDLTT